MEDITLSAEQLKAAASLIDVLEDMANEDDDDDEDAYSKLRGAQLMLNALGLDYEDDDDLNTRIYRIEAAESR